MQKLQAQREGDEWRILRQGEHGRGPILNSFQDVDGMWIAEHWDSGLYAVGSNSGEAVTQVLKDLEGLWGL